MATWGLHMRIAEKILEKHKSLDEAYFVVGNIGPDCGVPNEDWSKFTPDSETTHWSSGGKKGIQAEAFRKAHLDSKIEDSNKSSFLIGYYVHLLTDIAFSYFMQDKKEKEAIYQPLESDPKFIWTIKKDWYDLDHKYFRDYPDNIFFRTFRHVEQFPDYLDYFPKGAIQRQVDYITKFYLAPPEGLDRPYIYLSEAEMSSFIEKTTQNVIADLSKNALI
jgi:hypothetical protein